METFFYFSSSFLKRAQKNDLSISYSCFKNIYIYFSFLNRRHLLLVYQNRIFSILFISDVLDGRLLCAFETFSAFLILSELLFLKERKKKEKSYSIQMIIEALLKHNCNIFVLASERQTVF